MIPITLRSCRPTPIQPTLHHVSPIFTARPLADLRSALEPYPDPISFSPDCHAALYLAAAPTSESRVHVRDGAIFPKATFTAPTDYLVLRWQAGRVESHVIPQQTLVVSFVQPWRDGLLLASARTRGEENAIAFDARGEELARFSLGDGIEDLRVTPDGTLWACYSDQGDPRRRSGRAGAERLVALRPDDTFDFPYHPGAGGALHDVQALNVAGDDDVWLYFYTGFPLVRIRRGRHSVWHPGRFTIHALAVRDDKVLLFGDGERKNLAHVLELGHDQTATVVDEREVVDDEGRPLDGALARGVGPDLYLFHRRRAWLLSDW